MAPNLLVIFASAFIPFILAFAWFHPKLFGGNTWQTIANLTEEQNNRPVKPIQLVLSIVLNFLIAMALFGMVIHSSAVVGMLGGDVELLKTDVVKAFMDEYGQTHLHFGHGVLHGGIAAVFTVFPILGYATIFERKSFKYFWVNALFWFISMMLMGGIICQWGWQVIA